jgi:LCP family protein required for cell wall assembly
MAQDIPTNTPSKRKPDRVSLIVLAVLVVLGLILAAVAYNAVRDFVEGWNVTNLPGVSFQTQPTAAPGSTAAPSSPSIAEIGPTAQPWDGSSRVTVLLMGLDYRDWQANEGAPRSDSMWLLTIDPLSKTAGMMSIPRDTWVQIPGGDFGKINTAYSIGEGNKLPGGGPALAQKAVEAFLGVPIDYYAQIDFQAFVDFIDELDGVWIDVPSEIKVDPLGKGNTVVLQPGRQKVWGAVALGYARNRYEGGSDFERSKRQLQVIMAIRDRVMEPNYLPKVIKNAPRLYSKLSAGIHTNMNISDAIQLALLAQQIQPENIHKAVIGPNEEIDATNPSDGQAIEIPIYDRIRLLRDQVFTTGGPLGPSAVGQDAVGLAKQENAKIEVLNGSLGLEQSAGLAGRTGDYLKSLGLNVTRTDNGDHTSTTIIIDHTGKPYTLSYLVNQLHVGTNGIRSSYDPNSAVDVTILVGDDWALKNSMPNQ